MTAVQIFLVISGIVGGVLLLWLFFYLNNNLIKTTRYTLELSGLDRDITLVQISDLHGKSFGADNVKLIERVRAVSPDVIAITGDLIDNYGQKGIDTAVNAVAALSAISPVLYVSGNHEMRSTQYRFFKKRLSEAGAIILDDRVENMLGVTFVGLNGANNKNGVLARITPDESPKILLAHMPHHIKNYAAQGYDIVLSGHAHGGQWRIPFTDIGIYAPGQGIFPKLTSGVHDFGRTRLIISRGLGNSRCPVRLFNRPEIVVVKFTKISTDCAACDFS